MSNFFFGCGLITGQLSLLYGTITYRLRFGFRCGACWTVAVADKYVAYSDLLKNKSRPEAAVEGAPAWVISERELRERLKKEREAKEREIEKEVRLVDGMSKLSGC